MKLTIKPFNGSNDFEPFELGVIKQNSSPNYSLLENAVIKIELECDHGWHSASMLIGEYEFHCRKIPSDDEKSHFIWEPAYRKNGFGFHSLFHNYFGIVQITIELTNESGSQLVPFEPIEIFAKKLTADRTEKMLNFLLESRNEHTLSLISPASVGGKLSTQGITPGELLGNLEDTVTDAERFIRKIIKNPIRRLKNKETFQSLSSTSHLDEHSITWILENIGTCLASDSREEAQFSHDNTWYKIPEAIVYTSIESTDIYENKIIYVFLKKLKAHLDIFLKQLNDSLKPNTKPVPAGYVSFFQLLETSTGRTKQLYKSRIADLEERLRVLNNLVTTHIPVTNHHVRGFSVTERIKKNRPYLDIMRIIRDWFIEKRVQWHKLNLLVNINNTPKLFELYCALSLNQHLHNKAGIEPTGLFNHAIHDVTIELLYDHPFYKPRHKSATDSLLVNTDLERRRDALNDGPSKSWSHVYHNRRPDLTILIKDSTDLKSVWIFDAKYKDPEAAYAEDLPLCTMKYFHGLNGIDGSAPVKGVFILHPVQENSFDRNYLDFHAHPYNIFGDSPVLPALGTLGIEVESFGKETEFFRLIDKCLLLSH